jgi:hypothetical protein
MASQEGATLICLGRRWSCAKKIDPWEVAVLLAIVGVAGLALVTGLTLRAPALIAATLAVIAASIAAGSFLHLSVETTIRSTLYLVVVTQIAYLAGLALAVLWHRPRRAAIIAQTVSAPLDVSNSGGLIKFHHGRYRPHQDREVA